MCAENNIFPLLHVSRVACHMLPVTSHLSLILIATATDPPPANFLSMHTMQIYAFHSRLVINDPKTQKNIKTLKKKVF